MTDPRGAVTDYQGLARRFNLPATLAEILWQRGFSTEQEVEHFLYPDFSCLPRPEMMAGMAEAVGCIARAHEAGREIIIHGDYDVDGITATVLLVRFFSLLGISSHYYLPNRLTERYGLTVESVEAIRRQFPGDQQLLITVDCGVTACEAVEHARDHGFEVVITDHHEPAEQLPRANALLNPKQGGCSFPFKQLSGVGVAFFLVAALRRHFIELGLWSKQSEIPNLRQYLDLVALGTIADVMPLVATNRILVRAGLEVLNQRQRVGLRALMEQCNIHPRDRMVPEDVSYKLAPRLNAAGRMGKAEVGVELFLCSDQHRARQLAGDLEGFNRQRKQLEQDVLTEVFAECATRRADGAQGLAIYHPSCHPGILGIVASRVVDRFSCPAIVVTRESEADGSVIFKGSGRSVRGFNLHRKVSSCRDCLKNFGGHPMAIGLSLDPERWPDFVLAFEAGCDQEPALVPAAETAEEYCLQQDQEIFSDEFLSKLQLFQPFGEGNPEPLFLLRAQRLNKLKDIRGHLKFSLSRDTGPSLPGIGFFLGEKIDQAQQGPVDLVFKLKRSFFRGVQRKEIQMIAMR
ncbi:single-stranded-DNA-specific exonuclease RecJ [Desulfogranum mediterraneum]|uniref:single-stranded-DNA-specific exonuclease RecJ n=1 Tax=Desulfogranum mediterraneum TaxID=160661 RepID=UPI000428BECE|nr:single-stranded-DNA-specific exonuclease RecJ [Desulfogranum mediterraneum]